jgi:hypothetical protein
MPGETRDLYNAWAEKLLAVGPASDMGCSISPNPVDGRTVLAAPPGASFLLAHA